MNFISKKQKELLSLKQKAEEQQLLTKEQSRELRQKIILLEKEFSNELEKLEQENSELKSIINKSNNNSEPDFSVSEKQSIQLTDDELKVLLAFSGHNRRSAVEVSDDISMKLEKVKFICTDLMQKALLTVNGSNKEGQYLFALEQPGRKYLHSKNLL